MIPAGRAVLRETPEEEEVDPKAEEETTKVLEEEDPQQRVTSLVPKSPRKK